MQVKPRHRDEPRARGDCQEAAWTGHGTNGSGRSVTVTRHIGCRNLPIRSGQQKVKCHYLLRRSRSTRNLHILDVLRPASRAARGRGDKGQLRLRPSLPCPWHTGSIHWARTQRCPQGVVAADTAENDCSWVSPHLWAVYQGGGCNLRPETPLRVSAVTLKSSLGWLLRLGIIGVHAPTSNGSYCPDRIGRCRNMSLLQSV